MLSGSTSHSFFFLWEGGGYFAGIAQRVQNVGPTVSSLNPCPSLPSVATDDRQQFQCLNIVLLNKTGSLFAEFNDGKIV